MPTQQELQALGRGDIKRAIAKFGGYAKLAEMFDYPYQTRGSWKSIEDLRPHIIPSSKN